MSELALKLINKAIEEKATFIDLGNCGLKAIPDEIIDLPSTIEHINLGGFYSFGEETFKKSANNYYDNDFNKNLSSLFLLAKLANLKKLEFYGCNIKSEGLKWIRELSQLSSLNLNFNSITIEDIKDITSLNNLKLLLIMYNKIGDEGLKIISKLKNLSLLNVKGNGITPNGTLSIPKMEELTNLDISYNMIGDIGSASISKLPKLKILDIGSTKIGYKGIESITKLNHLVELDISGNQINDENVESLKELSKLTSLHIGFNKIGDRSAESISSLLNLTNLDISDTNIGAKGIESISKLGELKSLNLSYNKIEKGIESLSKLKKLTFLNLDESEFVDADVKNIGNLFQLTKLSLNGCNIGDKGAEYISHLSKLKYLDIGDNQIGDYGASSISKLSQLTSLTIQFNQIGDIGASSISKLSKLTSLKIGFNQIGDGGAISITKLSQLTYLEISENKIGNIGAESIVNLRKLHTLYIDRNILSRSIYFKKHKKLQDLSLWRNPLTDVPVSIIVGRDCLKNLRIWWKETEDFTQVSPNKLVKLQVMGNGNAGKSSIIEAIRNGTCKREFTSTHGIVIEALQYKLEDEEVNFQVWDFGGQELYHGTHKLFISSQSINMIVGDDESEEYALKRERVSDRDNPEELVLHQPLQHYINLSIKQSSNSFRLIVQNKIDKLNSKDNKNLSEIARLNKIDFLQASALQGTGINKLRKKLGEKRKGILHYDMLMPNSWLAVRQYFLDNLNKKELVRTRLIDFDIFNDICRNHNVSDYAINALLDYLHETGIIYKNEKKLKEIIIADQKWALEAIYKVLDRKSVFYDKLRNDYKGRIQVKNIFFAFGNGYELEHKWLFIHFMNSCGLCFPFYKKDKEETEDSYYIFPEFLPIKETLPAIEIWKKANDIKVYTYKPNYLDYYRIQKIIVDLGNKTKVEYLWKTGIIVDTDKGKFRVEVDDISSIIKVSIESSAIDYYLLIIIDIIKERDEWEKVNWISDDGGILDLASLKKRSIKREDNENLIDGDEESELRNESGKDNLNSTLPNIEQPAPKRVVVSYASEDLEAVKDLEETLAPFDGRIQFLYDKRVVDGRSTYNPQIIQMFEDADCYIVLVSKKYQNKDVKDYIWKNEFAIIKKRNDDLGIPIYCIPVAPVIYNNDISPLSCFRKGEDPLPEKGHKRDQYLLLFVKEMIEQHFLKME